jgi:flavin reductase (DIM6/NTAB) family NADH-FMN oxidoreductase RutF
MNPQPVKRTLKPCVPLMPVPAVLVSCRDPDGRDNLITLGWVGVVCSSPPMLGIAIRPGRHSHPMIVASGEFGVNVPAAAQARAVDHCGIASGRDEDKFQATGLTRLPGLAIRAPLVAECPINLECVVRQRLSLGTHDLFLGEVLAVRVSESAMTGDRIDAGKVAPLAYAPEAHEYRALGELLGTFGFSAKR